MARALRTYTTIAVLKHYRSTRSHGPPLTQVPEAYQRQFREDHATVLLNHTPSPERGRFAEPHGQPMDQRTIPIGLLGAGAIVLGETVGVLPRLLVVNRLDNGGVRLSLNPPWLPACISI